MNDRPSVKEQIDPRLQAVSVGLPQPASWRGRSFDTGIFKSPVEGRVRVHSMNLEGDRQADLTVHGGVFMAVYAYPFEHYAHWNESTVDHALSPGHFGENLTTLGLDETSVAIGDVFRIGSTMLEVTQPRVPCFKLDMRMNRAGFGKEFLESGRSGWYLRVVEEGEIGAGDRIERIARDLVRVSIDTVCRLRFAKAIEPMEIERTIGVAALSPSWRRVLTRRLDPGAAGRTPSA